MYSMFPSIEIFPCNCHNALHFFFKKNTTEEITFEIVEHLGDISIQSNGWTKELNIVKWNGGSEKYDLRTWSPEHDKMSKGCTFHQTEMEALAKILKDRF